ncbi:hypothetical protein EYF80_005328 [Liparis tanakae]|uniref:Uncharacterized protein n=1 Tax=Liparis tanakae TaxID=230148 RepID=A0A4Z2J1W3_9TELE|nr:hypothetical protein EYF80_005328 [Liparis tanakae]
MKKMKIKRWFAPPQGCVTHPPQKSRVQYKTPDFGYFSVRVRVHGFDSEVLSEQTHGQILSPGSAVSASDTGAVLVRQHGRASLKNSGGSPGSCPVRMDTLMVGIGGGGVAISPIL